MYAVLFDWDGVLADSTAMYYESYVALARKYGRQLPINSVEGFRAWYDPAWENNYFEMGFTAQDLPEIAQFIAGFINYDPITVFPGVKSMLSRLAQRWPLAVVSTTPAATIMRKLEQHDLAGYFRYVSGGEGGVSNKAQAIANTLKRLNCVNGVMVGDTTMDISSGKANNMLTVGAGYGWITKERLLQSEPDICVERPEELEEAVTKLMSRWEER